MIDDARMENARGPLAGVPVGGKGFYDTAGVRTTAGAEHLATRVLARDAQLVRSLRAAGAVLVGKTNMHAMGMGTTGLDSHLGPVRNPWDASLVPGGSSSGSAATVAADLYHAAIDTDAVGSVRLPAACCNVVGFKPSVGRLSAQGILEGEPADPAIVALSHPSITARSAADAGAMLRVLAAASDLEPARREPRIAVARGFAADDVVGSLLEEALAGITPPTGSLGSVEVPFSEASFDIGGIDAARGVINGRPYAEADLIVLPTLAGRVPTVEQARATGSEAVSPDNTFVASYFGLPAASVPTGLSDQGGPSALQIVGPIGGDLEALAFARAVQQVHAPQRARRRPPGVEAPSCKAGPLPPRPRRRDGPGRASLQATARATP